MKKFGTKDVFVKVNILEDYENCENNWGLFVIVTCTGHRTQQERQVGI